MNLDVRLPGMSFVRLLHEYTFGRSFNRQCSATLIISRQTGESSDHIKHKAELWQLNFEKARTE